MLWYLGRIAQDLPVGSPQHKRAVLATILCVRKLVPLVCDLDFGPGFALIEAWARRFDDEPVGQLDVPMYLGARRARCYAYTATITYGCGTLAVVCQTFIDQLVVAAGATSKEAFGDPYGLCQIIREAVPNVPVVYLYLGGLP
jgi:hypothetical protein